jgi:hypothetical protein
VVITVKASPAQSSVECVPREHECQFKRAATPAYANTTAESSAQCACLEVYAPFPCVLYLPLPQRGGGGFSAAGPRKEKTEWE